VIGCRDDRRNPGEAEGAYEVETSQQHHRDAGRIEAVQGDVVKVGHRRVFVGTQPNDSYPGMRPMHRPQATG
jgi:hypothetical protein